jgi:hypothetical protein
VDDHNELPNLVDDEVTALVEYQYFKPYGVDTAADNSGADVVAAVTIRMAPLCFDGRSSKACCCLAMEHRIVPKEAMAASTKIFWISIHSVSRS